MRLQNRKRYTENIGTHKCIFVYIYRDLGTIQYTHTERKRERVMVVGLVRELQCDLLML